MIPEVLQLKSGVGMKWRDILLKNTEIEEKDMPLYPFLTPDNKAQNFATNLFSTSSSVSSIGDKILQEAETSYSELTNSLKESISHLEKIKLSKQSFSWAP